MVEPNIATAASKGRPRNDEATRIVQRCAVELANEGGIANATVDRIAQRSGVAKSTIYRRWPNGPAVVMDGFLSEILPLIGYEEKSTVIQTVEATIMQLVAALSGKRGDILRDLLGSAQHDPVLREAFLKRWIEPRRRIGREVLERGVMRGELCADADLDLMLDLLYGGVYYRLVVSFTPLTKDSVRSLVAHVFRSFAP
ncbi:TetR/AcrR family transcriptional regulator [Paraburkholderia solisilvae]|uniref:Putative HTH-type transcriptional regulator n=1 Tax=Paraburkholderia solisilvae TaxID=624376 RepID=A0A6J5DMW5_9BURK|nr:TetR/AcrR family transcriptional regulator [Paraburkholderia solisilvae]CAB3754561.1 putative HTH-type transcriptional regulator [Paraburkholderia solisilvae]